jgi:nitrogen fixation protein FixH
VDAGQNLKAAERQAKRFWISLVLLLFVIQCTIMGLVINLAVGDPSGAVVPNYHTAALNWDQTRRAMEAADRLGWKIEFQASDVADRRGMRAIELNIVNDRGQGLDELEIRGTLYHHAVATEVETVEFDAVGQGRYLTLVPAGRAGLWQLELDVEGASEPMSQSITFEVESS